MENDTLEGLEGILHLFSETGTEGGYWAFIDARYIKTNVPKGYCKKCGIWLKEQSGALQIARVYNLDNIDDEFLESGNLPEPQDCPNNNHEEEIGDYWDYDGLHVLQDGDHLTIYNPKKKDEELWSGVIALQHYGVFTQDAFGLWIHADQKGINREVWAEYFFGEYSAKLKPLHGRK